jgi:2-keto-4-pentenoate hydratase
MGWQPNGVPRFWKSGGPSRDAVLTHAALPAQGVQPSPADMRNRPLRLRLIEAEIALRLARDVNAADAAALTHDSAASLVDAMAVSIEVVDSRWQQGAQAPALLKLADLQSHGALALGAWRLFAARDWSTQACNVQIGGRPIAQFKGTHALGDPAWLLPTWLHHATRNGEEVRAGTVVTTGTWCGMLPTAAGDLVIVHFESVGDASVQL